VSIERCEEISPLAKVVGQNRERERAGHGPAVLASNGWYTRSLTLAVLTCTHSRKNSIERRKYDVRMFSRRVR
jgi:hypothetical protein